MSTLLQLGAGLAVAGVVAAGSTAFTAGAGLKVSAATQWLGGTATHTVNGADITTVAYNYTTGSTFTYVDLTFADTNGNGKAVTATAAGGAYAGGGAALACQNITAGASRCEVAINTTYTGTPAGTYTGLQTLTVTVA